MVYVPAGEFLMGTSDADIERFKEIFPLRNIARFDNERPQRIVFVDTFYIDKYEVIPFLNNYIPFATFVKYLKFVMCARVAWV